MPIEEIPLLRASKNLLAFSAGVDSSALFFLLIEHGISFDIALVDYGMRLQSQEEAAHAQALAKQYGQTCHTVTAPKFESDFEAQARHFRYQWFESLIAAHGYETLLTAHQLNDRLEWMLMRLTRGAGVSELVGMAPHEERAGYTLVRPLLGVTKADLLAYLHAHAYPYFEDESNDDLGYERNRFRQAFSDPLIAEFGQGIHRSFSYLAHDKAILEAGFSLGVHTHELFLLHLKHPDLAPKAADNVLKKLGYLLSAPQRQEIAEHESMVIADRWAIARSKTHLWIAPWRSVSMPKPFKEHCRTLGIPPKIRPYLYEEGIDPRSVSAPSCSAHQSLDPVHNINQSKLRYNFFEK